MPSELVVACCDPRWARPSCSDSAGIRCCFRQVNSHARTGISGCTSTWSSSTWPRALQLVPGCESYLDMPCTDRILRSMQGLAVPGDRSKAPHHPPESAGPRASKRPLHKGETSSNGESLIRSSSPGHYTKRHRARRNFRRPPQSTCICTSSPSSSCGNKRETLVLVEAVCIVPCEQPHHEPPHLQYLPAPPIFQLLAQPFQSCLGPRGTTGARLVGPSFNPVAPARWSRQQGTFFSTISFYIKVVFSSLC